MTLVKDKAKPSASSTTLEDVIENNRMLNAFPLDVEGAASAFRFKHGHHPLDNPALRPAVFAYDVDAQTWRQWEYGEGWIKRRSVLDAMTQVVTALCALEAWRNSESK